MFVCYNIESLKSMFCSSYKALTEMVGQQIAKPMKWKNFEIPHQHRRRRPHRKLDALQAWHVQLMRSQLLHHACGSENGRPHSLELGRPL